MDTPGISLFQGADLQINNSKNIEEEEDLEDQLRRKEELQNLLQAKLDDFNYDDSTINSSTNISVVSADNIENLYKDALNPNEQLKVLYDVRCREIQALKTEYDKFKADKTKEIESVKHQNILLEGELRQTTISLKNVENLLVDKTEIINNLGKNLSAKDAQISELQKLITEYESEILTYKSEVTELHLKLQSQNGPFNLNAKYNSEDMRKSMQAKMEKLEKAYAEEVTKFEICNTEKQVLQDEVVKLAQEKIALESDNEAILKSFNNAQLQCKDLINVIEALKNENDHFKRRLEENLGKRLSFNQMNSSDTSQNEKLEKLKNMLVDKSTELDSLKVKLRSYEDNITELLEYRQLKCDLYKKEFQKCDNRSHTKDLLIMQNDLQNYRRIIEDKNQQILSLNANNKDLKEKIEDMILQTRNEIQNMSTKYNMPQLENMRKELEKAEYMVNVLTKKLQESEEERLNLLEKLNEEKNDLDRERKSNEKNLKEIERLKTELIIAENKEIVTENEKLENDYDLLKNQLKSVMEHLEKTQKPNKNNCLEIVTKIQTKMATFLEDIDKESIEKGIIEEQVNSWKKSLDEITLTDPDEVLKTQYKEAVLNLHNSNEKVKDLEDLIQDLKNSITIAEGEKCSLNIELKEILNKLEESKKLIKNLEEELKASKISIAEKNAELKRIKLPETMEAKVSEKVTKKIGNLKQQLEEFKEKYNEKSKDYEAAMQTLSTCENEKEKQKTQIDKMHKEIEKLKTLNAKLEKQLQEACDLKSNGEINHELKEAQRFEKAYKARLDEELLRMDLIIRDEMQVEYQKRLLDVEQKYKKTFKETAELCKKQKADLEEQDKKFREYLKLVLNECEACTSKQEIEKAELAEKLQLLQKEFEAYKMNVLIQEQKFYETLKKMEKESQKTIEAWRSWSKKVVCSCLDIEATNKNVRERVLASMEKYDQEVAAIQKSGETKITKKSSKKQKS